MFQRPFLLIVLASIDWFSSQMATLAAKLRINLTHYHGALEYDQRMAHIGLQAGTSGNSSSRRPVTLSELD